MQEVKPNKKPLLFYWLIALLILFTLNTFVFPSALKSQVQDVDYGTFMDMMNEKEIGSVMVNTDEIVFTDKSGDNVYSLSLIHIYTSKELKNMDFEVLPSKTNFVFARSKNIDGERLYKLLKENGILVRHFNKKRIEDFIRVTIGTKEQMRAFVSEVKYILETEAKNK